jgi:hypothetical protein
MSEPARTHQFIIGYGPWARRRSYHKDLSGPSKKHPSINWLQFVFPSHFGKFEYYLLHVVVLLLFFIFLDLILGLM